MFATKKSGMTGYIFARLQASRAIREIMPRNARRP